MLLAAGNSTDSLTANVGDLEVVNETCEKSDDESEIELKVTLRDKSNHDSSTAPSGFSRKS